jgi:hypothetical protein
MEDLDVNHVGLWESIEEAAYRRFGVGQKLLFK